MRALVGAAIAAMLVGPLAAAQEPAGPPVPPLPDDEPAPPAQATPDGAAPADEPDAGAAAPSPTPGAPAAAPAAPATAPAPLESSELEELRRFEVEAFGYELGEELPPAGDRDGAVAPPPRPGIGLLDDLPLAARTDGLLRRTPPPPAPPDDPFLRSLKLPDLPIRWDPKLIRYLRFYKDDPRGRAIMTSWLRRQGRFRALIERTLARHGLPRGLLYLSMIESSYDPRTKSRVGASGLWQFMEHGGRVYGLDSGFWLDERRDPERATDAGARYLADLYARFGSWPLALASYNAGYGAVLQSIRRFNTNDFWELSRHENGLPWETTLYVPKALAAAIVGENRAAFGYDAVVPDPPFQYDAVTVPPATPLDAVARAVGCPAGEVEELNPELRRGRTPPGSAPYPVRVPRGAGTRFWAELARLRSSLPAVATRVVRFGERLEDLARAYGLSDRELRRLNGIEDSSELRAGLTILVPPGPAKATIDPIDPAEPLPLLVAVPDKELTVAGRDRAFYRIKPGDRLDEIARFFGVTADDLARWNAVDPAVRVQRDQVVQLFLDPGFDRTRAALLPADQVKVVTTGSEEHLDELEARKGRRRVRYTVREGETLVRIGRRFGLTPGDLARINKISYSADPTPGSELTVYVDAARADRLLAGAAAREPPPPAGRRPGAQPPPTRKGGAPARGRAPRRYVVQGGDSLTKIARRFGVTVDELARRNRLDPKASLPAGRELHLGAR